MVLELRQLQMPSRLVLNHCVPSDKISGDNTPDSYCLLFQNFWISGITQLVWKFASFDLICSCLEHPINIELFCLCWIKPSQHDHCWQKISQHNHACMHAVIQSWFVRCFTKLLIFLSAHFFEPGFHTTLISVQLSSWMAHLCCTSFKLPSYTKTMT